MRRFPAILLAFLFSFSLIGPSLWADAASTLPACCRRNGAHGCAMTGRQAAPHSGVTWQSSRCPSFPGLKALPTGRAAGVLPAAPAIFAGLVRHPAVHAQTEALFRISHDRAGQKRGPPLSLL